MDVQPTSRAQGRAKVAGATAVSSGDLVLTTLSRHPRHRIRRHEAAGQTKATHSKAVPRRSAHIGRRPSGRFLRGARLQTVWAHRTGAHRASHQAAQAGAGWRPAPLRTPSPRADHLVPPGAAARGQLHRSHRGQHWCRATPVHQGRVRGLPRVRHPGPRLPKV